MPLSDSEYIAVLNSPRARPNVDKQRLLHIIDTLSSYGVPESVTSDMRACFQKNADSYRVFDIKHKTVPKGQPIV